MLQKRGEYNISKNKVLFSEESFKEHLKKITENRYKTYIIKINNVLNRVQVPDVDEIKVEKIQAELEIVPTSEKIIKRWQN